MCCVKRFIKRSAPHARALTAQRSSGPHVERLSSRCAPHTISSYASCCGLRRDRMEAISLSGPGTHPWSPPPPGTTKLACPTHTPSHAKQGPELNEGDPGWPHPPAHKMHPPAHASAPAAVRPQSQRARPSRLRQHESPPQITSVQRSPSLLHPSGPRRQSQQPIPLTSLWPPKAEPAQIRKRMRHTASVSRLNRPSIHMIIGMQSFLYHRGRLSWQLRRQRQGQLRPQGVRHKLMHAPTQHTQDMCNKSQRRCDSRADVMQIT